MTYAAVLSEKDNKTNVCLQFMESRKSHLNKIKLIINSVQLKCGSYTMRKIVRINAVYTCTRARVSVKRCHIALLELSARCRLKVKGNNVATFQISHERTNLSINGFANSSITIFSVTRTTLQL
jgi:hypothetical protein